MTAPDDRPRPDEGLASELWLVGRRWHEGWQSHRANPPNTLYHYTDAAGLLGIVNGEALWASNAVFLNDASELIHIQQALTYVVSKLDKAYAADIVREFLWVTVDQFERLYIRGMEVFGVCFCENPDLLRQWRGYPASGGGYAIGFDTAAIAAGRFLRPIIYDEEAQRRTLRSLLTTQCELLPQAAKESDDYRKKCLLLAVQIATSSLVDCAFAFKHPKFAEEAEWRLVRVMMREREPPIGGTPLFRVGGTGLLPYTPFDLKSRDGRQPISEIIVGPSPHPDLAVGAARRLLESAGYDAAGMVKRSEIPLRV